MFAAPVKEKGGKPFRFLALLFFLVPSLSLFLTGRNLLKLSVASVVEEVSSLPPILPLKQNESTSNLKSVPLPGITPDLSSRLHPKATIAFAVTVTSCTKKNLVVDGASVLQHSIHLNSIRTRSSGSRYDYEMVAFVHPDGVDCIDILKALNYTIHVKTVPFRIDQISGNYRHWANRTGCCGEKEWLKLYAYTLLQHPIVVHLDLDCLVLKPLDDVFDAMLDGPDSPSRKRVKAMWIGSSEMPETIHALFTRDYGMIQMPGRRKPHQIGVQGGFLVVKPNQTVFDEYIDIILEGNYTEERGWGDRLGFGGYYGGGTIQGLAAMFYSHFHPDHAVELNRCIYNNMADCPYPKKYDKPEHKSASKKPCITLQSECEDCRKTDIDDIVTIHLTNCFKPWHCTNGDRKTNLCSQHHYEWYRIRHLLEMHWRGEAYNGTRSRQAHKLKLAELSFGFCKGHGPENYRPISMHTVPGLAAS